MAGRIITSENSRTLLTVNQSNVQANRLPQYVAAICATLAAMVAGSYMSWTSPALPLLQTAGVTDEEGSWIGSLFNLGAFLGALPAGAVVDRLGRKVTLCVLSVPLIGSWLLLAFSSSVYHIYLGRLLGGVAVGAISVAAPTYISELAESSIRGALGTFFQLQITMGILFGYIAGLVEDYRTLNLISCTLPVIFLITFVWMPESPIFLLTRNRKKEARRSLQWLRGERYNVDDELTKAFDTIEKEKQHKATLRDLLSSRGTVRALVVSVGLMTFQQFSGVNAVIFYSGKIFEASGSAMSVNTSSIIIGIVQVAATYTSTLLVDRAGRRMLLLLSSTVMAICLTILGFYFYFQTHDYNVTSMSWLPLASVAIFIVLFSMGFGPIPWIMMGELFPSNVKGIASAITASIAWLLAFTVTKLFQNMLDAFGSPITFWVFAAMCVVGTVFTATLVPETKGKDLREIQMEFSGREMNTVVENQEKECSQAI